jgi:hypothetical protein
LICLLAFSLKGNCQAQLMDTISYSLSKKPKFFMTLASFNTFIDGQYANIGGIRMGLNYNQRVRFGIGYFYLANNDIVTALHITDSVQDYTTSGQLYLKFVSLSAGYYFFNKYPWQCGLIPFQIGFGRAKYGYISRPERIKTYTKTETLILYQPEISFQYNVFRWIGAGMSTGYRFILYRSEKATKNLNAITFSIDVRLSLDEIYKIFFEQGRD